jgi:hypothetical protein
VEIFGTAMGLGISLLIPLAMMHHMGIRGLQIATKVYYLIVFEFMFTHIEEL